MVLIIIIIYYLPNSRAYKSISMLGLLEVSQSPFTEKKNYPKLWTHYMESNS